MRVDTAVYEQIKVLAEKLKVPIVDVMRIAVEKLEQDQVNEPG